MALRFSRLLYTFIILSNLFSASRAYAFSQTRERPDGIYQRTERQFVTAAEHMVESLCNDGDTLVFSECRAINSPHLDERLDAGAGRDLMFPSERDYPVLLDKSESSSTPNGVSCHAKNMHPQQSMKIESIVVCKKAVTNG